MRFDLLPASALRVTEEHDHERMLQLCDRIQASGVWTMPVCIERESHAVMDGHHRLEAAKRLGLARVPVYLLDYSQVTLTRWRDDIHVSVADILRRAYANDPYPKKTTRHLFPEELTRPCAIPLALLRDIAPIAWPMPEEPIAALRAEYG